MEKLTGQQIIEKLKTIFESVSDFAFDEIPYNEFSENALEAQKIKDEWVSKNPSPTYNTPEYEEWNKNYTSFPSKYDIAQKEYLEKNNIPSWKEVDQYGGEGQGDTWYSVKYFPEHDVYLRVDGWYQSYDGTNFSGWKDVKEVKPKQKTITVYE